MEKFRFLQWKVYKDARELAVCVIWLVKMIPKEYRFEIGSQIIRSASSIVLNIAEGSAKGSDRELNRYMDIALGSAYETLAAADMLLSCGIIDTEKFTDIHKRIIVISDQLGGFKKHLSRH